MEKRGLLVKIANKIKRCRKCDLYKTKTKSVPGEGSAKAKIMLIGEAPGKNEDIKGKPFVGAAGKVLDKLLQSVKLKRKDIFISNILHCRPPQNRNPRAAEIKACTPYLNQQINIIKPKIICPLGNFAASYTLEKFGKAKEKVKVSISKIHGKVFSAKKMEIIPLYHPAAAVYNPRMFKILLQDFKIVGIKKR